MVQRGVDTEDVAAMKVKLDEEEYDSDVVMEDIDVLKIYGPNANISKFAETKEEYDGIRDYIYNVKCLFIFFIDTSVK